MNKKTSPQTLAAPNVFWHSATVTRGRREKLNGHPSYLVWLTGLSGSGKSTIAHTVEERLHTAGHRTMVLDGDNVRHGLCSDLSFSVPDRTENIRRIGEVTKLFVEAGVIVLTAFISPLRRDRDRVRAMFQEGEFLEIYCKCPIETCERRDVKGLYEKARKGLIAEFTGISSPYEEPLAPELALNTDELEIDAAANEVISFLFSRGLLVSGGLKTGVQQEVPAP